MKLRDMIIIILFIISVAVALWYLFGSSPTFEQAILVVILTLSITNIVKASVLESRFINLEKSFTRLAHDFKEHIKLNKK